MTTERQIASNQRNASKSTGPRTPEGKAKSRANALKHGLAAETLVIDSLARTSSSAKPSGSRTSSRHRPKAGSRSMPWSPAPSGSRNAHGASTPGSNATPPRACLVWDLDREAEVALIASKLAKQPELVSHQLKTSKHGVELILRTWDRLGESLDTKKGAWSDAEISTAFDLLGIPGHLRDGRAPFDPAVAGDDSYQFRRTFVFTEGDRLRAKESQLARLDRTDREQAETGASILGTKPVALLLRYENAAWRRYETMLKAAKASAPQELVLPEVEPEQDFADDDATLEAEVQAMVANKTPARSRRCWRTSRAR